MGGNITAVGGIQWDPSRHGVSSVSTVIHELLGCVTRPSAIQVVANATLPRSPCRVVPIKMQNEGIPVPALWHDYWEAFSHRPERGRGKGFSPKHTSPSPKKHKILNKQKIASNDNVWNLFPNRRHMIRCFSLRDCSSLTHLNHFICVKNPAAINNVTHIIHHSSLKDMPSPLPSSVALRAAPQTWDWK